ncbi:MAG: hypothetical protein HKUEN07_03720 [Rhodocyclaceae bacterium]|uniref:Replication-associated protein G2P N-terminal domain-containing protein n=1 Tax=Candidatus Desulfobacillus denitrificans TaxID=2608985 RepID=A0A809R2B9_9PROT|nr:conserved hypothetical protein [Candidatus Desulfobacillus denitrificans]GIK46173.1 MAG: hypothetical protein BroJett012_20760 [Betaproteobacteria bacterium]GJQ53803.1 MAG: hypothetical protein HKUEN07_03720 [Rhodocyclaceae bacterium]
MTKPAFDSVLCDWLGGSHAYPEPVKPLDSGRILRIDRDGVIEYEKRTWEQIRCPSSDTSIRVRCDGKRLDFTGNIGRFQKKDNLTGLGILECVDRWSEVMAGLGLDVHMFGAVIREGTVAEVGTRITRVDLASNFRVSDYAAFCRSKLSRPIGRRYPREGKYGPTWGYEAKRSNWWKAKVYDKDAELQGLRASKGGDTTARFEIQLGGGWLKRENLHTVKAWGDDMAKIIYGRFASELFRESTSVEEWGDIPARLRGHAILWRDGVDLRQIMSQSAWYRTKSRLLEFGVDIRVPCNVVALTSRCRTIEIEPLHCIREAA